MARRLETPRAIISGQAGIVIFTEGKVCNYRRMGCDELRPCRTEDIPYLLGEATDTIALTGRSVAQADRILENEWKNDRALHLSLILLDSEAHLRAKRIAADSLEEMLRIPTVFEFVRDRLYARLVPPTADLIEAVQMSSEYGGKVVWSMLMELRKDQPVIERVRDRWDRLEVSLFGTPDQKRQFERIAIEEGMFFDLCGVTLGRDMPKNWAKDIRLKPFQWREKILEAWTAPFVMMRKDVRAEIQSSFDEFWTRQAE